jgi:hypothetical protein
MRRLSHSCWVPQVRPSVSVLCGTPVLKSLSLDVLLVPCALARVQSRPMSDDSIESSLHSGSSQRWPSVCAAVGSKSAWVRAGGCCLGLSCSELSAPFALWFVATSTCLDLSSTLQPACMRLGLHCPCLVASDAAAETWRRLQRCALFLPIGTCLCDV